jgi:hypothetical protein
MSGLHPPFVHLVVTSVVPRSVGPQGMLTLIEEPVGGSASRRPVEDRGDTPF